MSPAKSLNPRTDLHKVWTALNEMPGVPMTSQELADETGLTLKQCSGYAYTLRKMGLAQSRCQTRAMGVRGARYEHWVGELL